MTLKTHDKTAQDTGTLRRHDLIVSGLLWLISLFVFFDSFRMTFGITLPGVEINIWRVAPGFLPLLFSGGLLIMLSSIIWISFREGDFKGHFSKSNLIKSIKDREIFTRVLQMLLLCLFVFGLIGRLHFGLAAAIYLFLAMMIANAAKLYQIALISVLFSAAITYIFGTLMKIPLP